MKEYCEHHHKPKFYKHPLFWTSAIIAFEIFRKTGALGNAFAFLNAGVATDYTELGLIWKNIGRKAAIWMLMIALPQILILSYLMNVLL